MALPGRITDTQSFGSNNLIRSGKARMILTANDIIEDLGWDISQQVEEQSHEVSPLEMLDPTEQLIYKAFDNAATLDWAALTAATGLTMGELAMALMNMELKGVVRCLPGKRYERI